MAGLFVALYVFNLRDTNSAAADFCRIQSLTRHITQSRGTIKPPVCLPLDPEEESADLFLPAFIFSSPLPPLSKKNMNSDQQNLQKLWGPIHCLEGGGHFS